GVAQGLRTSGQGALNPAHCRTAVPPLAPGSVDRLPAPRDEEPQLLALLQRERLDLRDELGFELAKRNARPYGFELAFEYIEQRRVLALQLVQHRKRHSMDRRRAKA